MTKQQARAYVEEVARMWDAEPCRYGHLGCATRKGGMCSDEVAQLHKLDSEEE